jgi:hypothetical protein
MRVAAYAKARGVSEVAIRNQIHAGVIRQPRPGFVDVEQADAAWFRIRRARVAIQQDDAGTRAAAAKIASVAVKLQLARVQFDGARERYVDRAAAIEQAGLEVAAFLAALEEIPAARAAELARLVGVRPAVARKLLQRFMAAAIAELGDLAGDAVRIARAA